MATPWYRSVPPPAGSALLISTSGSEGQPRLVCLDNAALIHAARQANRVLGLRTGDLWLACLPLFHIGGQSILWRCALAGAGVVLQDDFSLERLASDLAEHPVSHISLVPAMLARLLDAGVPVPATLRVALIGGAALSHGLYERAQAAGWPLYPSYGMSESAALLAVWTPEDGPWQPGAVGRPLPGWRVEVTDAGRLRIAGPSLMLGTLDGQGRDPDGFFTTGDLGALDDAGRLSVLGRADDMLISGGTNIHPSEIEDCLSRLPGVQDLAVTAQADPVWGDRIVMLFVGSTPPAVLAAHARTHLRKAAWPRDILQVDALPRNATGKLDRRALRQLAARLVA